MITPEIRNRRFESLVENVAPMYADLYRFEAQARMAAIEGRNKALRDNENRISLKRCEIDLAMSDIARGWSNGLADAVRREAQDRARNAGA